MALCNGSMKNCMLYLGNIAAKLICNIIIVNQLLSMEQVTYAYL
jgi:hypothetical protein